MTTVHRLSGTGILQTTTLLDETGIVATGPPTVVISNNFADSAISGIKIGTTTVEGGSTTDDYFGPTAYNLTMGTAGSWTAVGCLFTNGSNTNSYTRSVKDANSGSTFNGGGSSSTPFNIVIDLGQVRTFNHARYYQMFSDGKTTHAALDISSSGNLETRTSANWTQVHAFNVLDNSSTSDGIGVNFTSTTARYIRLRIYNDDTLGYGSSSYTELYNFKLFNVSEEPGLITTPAQFANNGIFGVLDEVTSNGSSIPMRLTRGGNISISNIFDETGFDAPVASFGQEQYIIPGTYSWVAPDDVTSVSVVCVGGGGGGENYYGSGGGGGALAYLNNISVVPGTAYTVVVGAAGVRDTSGSTGVNGTDGGTSFFIDTSTVAAGGGKKGVTYTSTQPRVALGGVVIAGTGFAGGSGNGTYVNASPYRGGGGGGAAGYTGVGGNGSGNPTSTGTLIQPTSGSGGGGGGGNGDIDSSGNVNMGGGGGVGLLGLGANGAAAAANTRDGGGGGSGGGNGGNGAVNGSNNNNGGTFGGGGGSGFGNNATTAGNGSVGAVRIIWPGTTRQFPSTNTGNL